MIKVNSLKLNDPGFPASLAAIPQAPAQIYWLGLPPEDWIDKPKVAIVGSRKTTSYGRDVAAKMAGELAAVGVVIISGLAYGIDSIAHQAALDAGGSTVAVLPTGLDRIYPSAHTNLAKQIIARGALISEYPPGSVPHKFNFTARNRIVTGLADLVLIVEAAAKSGTLNTARFGLEQGKTVAAIPGSINSINSEGTNNLIKSGALPITSVDDIFFALNLSPDKTSQKVFRGSQQEEAVLELIRKGVEDQEDLAVRCKLDGATIASILITLELAGVIKPGGGGKWIPH